MMDEDDTLGYNEINRFHEYMRDVSRTFEFFLSFIDSLIEESDSDKFSESLRWLRRDILLSCKLWYCPKTYKGQYDLQWPSGYHEESMNKWRQEIVKALLAYIPSRKFARKELEGTLKLLEQSASGSLSSDLESFGSEIMDTFDRLK